MFRNILVAIDGSPDSDQALAQAIDLAESQHSRLTIFSAVVTPPTSAYISLLWAPADAAQCARCCSAA